MHIYTRKQALIAHAWAYATNVFTRRGIKTPEASLKGPNPFHNSYHNNRNRHQHNNIISICYLNILRGEIPSHENSFIFSYFICFTTNYHESEQR